MSIRARVGAGGGAQWATVATGRKCEASVLVNESGRDSDRCAATARSVYRFWIVLLSRSRRSAGASTHWRDRFGAPRWSSSHRTTRQNDGSSQAASHTDRHLGIAGSTFGGLSPTRTYPREWFTMPS